MRHPIRSTLLLAVAVTAAAGVSAQPAEKEKEKKEEHALRSTERFSGTTTLRTGEKKTGEIRFHSVDWSIDNFSKIERFPEKGLVIAQLKAGTLTTIIDGKREKRAPSSFWTVPAGAVMAIETERDSVILHTVAIIGPDRADADHPRDKPVDAAPSPGVDKPAPGGDKPAPGADKPAPGGDKPAPKLAPGGDKPAPGGDKPAPPR